MKVLFPIEFQIKTFRIVAKLGMDLSKAQQQRLAQLNELDESIQEVIHQTTLIQQQRTRWHDKLIKKKTFKLGDWALLFESRYKKFKGKFSTRWLGTYEVEEFYDNGAVKIRTIYAEGISFLINGHRLRVYNKPLNWEEFITHFLQQSDMEIMKREDSFVHV
jgi:hypothetical protein